MNRLSRIVTLVVILFSGLFVSSAGAQEEFDFGLKCTYRADGLQIIIEAVGTKWEAGCEGEQYVLASMDSLENDLYKDDGFAWVQKSTLSSIDIADRKELLMQGLPDIEQNGDCGAVAYVPTGQAEDDEYYRIAMYSDVCTPAVAQLDGQTFTMRVGDINLTMYLTN